MSAQKVEKEEALDAEESIIIRIQRFRDHFNCDANMTVFDRDILESLIEKVVVGANDEEGIPKPYIISFVFKSGIKFSNKFYEKVANNNDKMEVDSLSTYPSKNSALAYSYTSHPAC